MGSDGRFDLNRSGLASEVRPILEKKMRSITRRIANQARQDVPVKTGRLGRSIREDELKFVGPFRVEGGVSANTYYAAYVHEGTRYMRKRPFLLNAARRVIAQER